MRHENTRTTIHQAASVLVGTLRLQTLRILENAGDAMKLNENEKKVLGCLASLEPFDYNDTAFTSFAHISEATELDRKAVRRACRSLTRKGLAVFGTGLCKESGEFAGSGYGATKAGRDLALEMEEGAE